MYSIELSNEKRKQKSEYMKGNSNAVKTFGKDIKQRKTEQNRTEQRKTCEDIEDIEDIKNNKKDLFDLFRKTFPHARK
jgi:hypothetical protein